MNKKSVFVIIPAFNEAEVLEEVLSSIIPKGYAVVVVDDGSSDHTWQVLRSQPVHALRHVVNLGQGAALQTGMVYALQRGAEIIIHFDADGQHRIQDIERVMEPVVSGEADVAIGSRFLRFQEKQTMPWMRAVLLRGAVIVNGLLTGLWLSDAHNGLRALSRQAASHIRLRENRFAHATEIIHEIRKHKLRLKEVPTHVRYTEYSMRKGQSFWNAFNILIDMFLRGLFK